MAAKWGGQGRALTVTGSPQISKVARGMLIAKDSIIKMKVLLVTRESRRFKG